MATMSTPRSPGRRSGPLPTIRSSTPESLTGVLMDVAVDPALVVLIDVPALERSSLAKFDSAMVAVVEALCRVKVQLALLTPHDRELLERIHRELPLARCFASGEDRDVLARVRERAARGPVLAISDDPDLLTGLAARDRGLALGGSDSPAMGNILRMGDLNVRATLWWLVYVRTDAGLAE
jgi:hypothetical protein